MAAMAYPTPMPRAFALNVAERQFLDSLGSLLDPASGGSGGTDGSGGGGTDPTTIDSSISTTTTSSSSSSSPSSSSSSTPITSSSSSSSSSARPSDTTSSTRQTVTSATTSNGVVIQTTIVSEQPTVVTTMPTADASSPSSSSGSSSNGGLIGGVVGGVVGGLALITLLILIAVFWRRRKARTGHGWFLCFGQRPNRKDDLDVDWPTFDPTVGAAGVGGTFGEANGNRRKNNALNGGTLPNVDEGEGYNGYNGYSGYDGYAPQDEMQDVGAYSAGAPSYVSPTSDGTHHRQQSQQWHMSPMASYSNAQHSTPSHTNPPSVPDYSHLDAPEVREERAREHAQAQAMAAAQAAAGGYTHNSSPSSPPARYGSPVGSASPPPPSAGGPRPLSDHRLSQGTAQMLSDNNFFLSPEDESGTAYNDGSRPMLHLHNPDA